MTQLTLRQARKLTEKINQHIPTISTAGVVHLNIWDIVSVDAAVGIEHGTFTKNVERVMKLMEAREELRNSISQANTAEIDEKIAARKNAMDRHAFLKDIVTRLTHNKAISSISGAEAKLAQLRETGSERAYIREETLNVAVVTEEERQGFEEAIVNLQRTIEQLDNALLELNVSTKIELSQETYQNLQAEKLL